MPYQARLVLDGLAWSALMRRLLRRVALSLLAAFVGLALLEGICSFGSFGFSLLQASDARRTEHRHTQYDSQLGWSSIPGAVVQDVYEPGTSVRINAQGFRAGVEFDARVPAGKVRLVCSGDSFTFGHGVGDEHPWCQMLSRLEPRLETVNMGQSGYGLDQVYLWYRRDGQALEQDLHLLAIFEHDFLRMGFDSFAGYGKPVLRLQDGQLVTGNVPVPRLGYLLPWLHGRTQLVSKLHLVQTLRGVASLLSAPEKSSSGWQDGLQLVAARIFDELRALHQAKGSVLVLVVLPDITNYQVPHLSRWRRFVRDYAAQHAVPLIDLAEPLAHLPPALAVQLFLRDGHYSVRGNLFMAERILAALHDDPRTASRLQPPRR